MGPYIGWADKPRNHLECHIKTLITQKRLTQCYELYKSNGSLHHL